MYCKHCGNPMNNLAAVCVYCGVPKGQGANFCAGCGSQLTPGNTYCMRCGAPANVIPPGVIQKSKTAAGLLAIFIGSFGVHNFYLGYTGKALAQLLMTVLSCGILAIVSSIWAIVEGVQILTGGIAVDAAGIPLKD